VDVSALSIVEHLDVVEDIGACCMCATGHTHIPVLTQVIFELYSNLNLIQPVALMPTAKPATHVVVDGYRDVLIII